MCEIGLDTFSDWLRNTKFFFLLVTQSARLKECFFLTENKGRKCKPKLEEHTKFTFDRQFKASHSHYFSILAYSELQLSQFILLIFTNQLNFSCAENLKDATGRFY